jgi:ABC-type dipeptide/oligopeptide/nickel transport system permease subunit
VSAPVSTLTTKSLSAPRVEQTGILVERRRRWPLLHRFLCDRTSVLGLAIVATLVVIAMLAPLIAPYDPLAIDARASIQPSSREHWLGTDQLGRDILSRLIHGSRWTLGTSLLATLGIVTIGTAVGLISGYFAGLVDELLMRLVDVFLAFPSLVLMLAIVGLLGPSLPNVMLSAIAVWWVAYARVVRGVTLSLRDRDFVMSAHCAGCSPWRVLRVHLFPNAIPPIIVLASLELGTLILALSGLSFLGLGAQPPTPEWGTMLNEGRTLFQRAPQLMIYPGVAITLSVLGFNLIGDGLRDVLDPRLTA